jgi:hypothetical protein
MYRKTCNNEDCRKKFKGRKTAKYCCVNCRVASWNRRKSYDYLKSLRDILELELEYLPKKEAMAVIKVCLYAIKKARKNTKES